ncbi:MAG: GDP-mannose 4,6-dehydratase [Candidatus Omnitrophica bacterium]|nr:GDP-mannose 4,6-dehydratase [Candidatus Omnitrophota bacterium]
MKVLITGGAGFIGSHLAEAYLRKGDEVTILDDLSTGSWDNIASFEDNPRLHVMTGSILNGPVVEKLVDKCDVIFHLAAAVGVELVVKRPLESLTTNIKGSEIVIDMAYRYHKKILITSTSEIYGKNTNGPLKETDDRILGSPLKSRWGYSTAKAVDEMLAYIYWKEKGLPSIIVRLFNTVGPRQTGSYGMVIPRFVKQAINNENITVYGSGKQTRCFLHVGDAVNAIAALMDEKGAVGEVFNIGSQEEVSIEKLAEKIIKLTGSKSNIVYVPYNQAYEEGFEDMQRRVPDTGKINKLIGFKPSYNLEEIINDVIGFYRRK